MRRGVGFHRTGRHRRQCQSRRSPQAHSDCRHHRPTRRSTKRASRGLRLTQHCLCRQHERRRQRLAQVVKQVAAMLGPERLISSVEMHHRKKVDAPSGTALLLGRAAATGAPSILTPWPSAAAMASRRARRRARSALRPCAAGSVPGDHTVMFASDSERLELTHRAQGRIRYLPPARCAPPCGPKVSQPAGLYDMKDVLGLDGLAPAAPKSKSRAALAAPG